MVLGKGLNERREKTMYFVIFSVMIGMVIGLFTNALAIKMLFRPFHPVKIGKWQLPFTPGLIPKRKDEIALQLGSMVERYLFTVKGLKQFIQETGLKERIFERLMEKLDAYQKQEKTLGEELDRLLTQDWRKALKEVAQEKTLHLLQHTKGMETTLEDLLSEDTVQLIEAKTAFLSEAMINELVHYLHSLEGRRMLETLIRQGLEGRMIRYIAGFLLEGEQIQQKLTDHLDQLLKQKTTKEAIQKILLKEWELVKKQPLQVWFLEYEETINREANRLLEKGIQVVDEISLGELIFYFKKNKWFDQGVEWFIGALEERVDKVFHYIKISEVVTKEVRHFSLEKLEKMLIEVAGRELKMITYFGGVLGGMIGFIQGMLYLLF